MGSGHSFNNVLRLARDRFASDPSIEAADSEKVSFYIDDKDYGVWHRVEDFASEIYDGAVLEVRLAQGDGHPALHPYCNPACASNWLLTDCSERLEARA